MIVRRPFRLLVAFCTVVVGCAASASPAGASFGISSFEASYSEAPLAGAEAEALGPPDFQAGSHPYQFTTKLAFNTTTNAEGKEVVDGFAKNVQIKLPRGVVGNLAGIPRCPQSVFMARSVFSSESPQCPVDTQVGVMAFNGGQHPLFNLVPPPGAAGQVGALILVAPVLINFSIRNSDGYSLTAEMHNLSELEEAKEISISLWGIPADSRHDHLRCMEQNTSSEHCPSGALHEALLTMPTSCAELLTTTITAQSWEHPDVSAERSTTATGAGGHPGDLFGCERLHFDPSVTVQPESPAVDTPTGLSIGVQVPFRSGTAELAEASLEDLRVALPEGLSINAATSGGLAGCAAAQFGAGQDAKPTCPDASKIGTLEIQTPILSKPLNGFVYLAQPPPGLFEGNVGIYLAGEQSGFDFKLAGQLSAQLDSGQLTLTLDGMPELPISEVRLNLSGGPRGAIANPDFCAALATSTELTSYATSATALRSNGFAIDEGCSGGFGPSFKAGSTSSAAGLGTGFELQVNRSDGQQYFQNLTAALPPGVMADINSVPQCGDAEAAAGTCPAASQIGTISVAAGAGSDPFYLSGRIYLTGPYGGAPFGLSMVIPASAGPFDLGTVLVRGRITVDLATSVLTIATDSFPTILQGIPLRIKSLDLAIDRPGFLVNPTSCIAQHTNGTVASTAGSAAAVSAPFGVVGCAGLPFAPTLTSTTLGKASRRGNGASLDVKVTDPQGTHANLKSLVIKLPKPLKPRLSAVQNACLLATFSVNPQACPSASVVGTAQVATPMLGAPLTGPVYMVFHRGAKFPDLMLVLQGSGLKLQLKGTVEVTKGISTTTFSPLPDIPMSLFELDLPEGSHSLLGATENLCAKSRKLLDALAGQNGARSESSVKTTVEGCPGRAAKASARRRTRASKARRPARGRKARSR